jgi:hypothetical protein
MDVYTMHCTYTCTYTLTDQLSCLASTTPTHGYARPTTPCRTLLDSMPAIYSSTAKEKNPPSAADVDNLLKGDVEFAVVDLRGE